MTNTDKANIEIEADGALVPLPLERIAKTRPAEWLVNDTAFNRGPEGTCMIEANNDIDAVQSWLASYNDSPRTLRAYSKEISRFYNWLVLIRHKSISSVTLTDVQEYERFTQKPLPSWCGDRYGRRGTEDWRPFEGPLSVSSRRQAMTVLSSCFAYLANTGYLVRNPFSIRRGKSSTRVRKVDAKRRHLSIHDFELLVKALEARIDTLANASPFKRLVAERELFVVRFLGNTGLRREELAVALMSEFEQKVHSAQRRTYYVMHVRGKGGEVDEDTGEIMEATRTIALNPGALDALTRYREVNHASQVFAGNDTPVLLPLRARTPKSKKTAADPVTGSTVFNIVKKALAHASEFYAESAPQTAGKLAQATPHWFRHTFATILAELGVRPNLIQAQLGHASVTTTMSVYIGIEEVELLDAVSLFKG